MASEYMELVGALEDDNGEEISVYVITGSTYGDDEDEAAAVYVDAPGMTLGKHAREDFQRLFMEAERLAEAGGAVSG